MVKRSVWEDSKGSTIMSVKGLLLEGEYKITKTEEGRKTILEFERK